MSSFVEVSTCHYQIIVSTPRLCEEMNLSHKHHGELHTIECKPIVSDKLIEQEQVEEPTPEEHQELDIVVEQLDEKDVLLGLISDLTDQINQLKVQMNSKPEVSFFTFDTNGKIIPAKNLQHVIKQVKRPEQSKEQHDNKQAYHQNYNE